MKDLRVILIVCAIIDIRRMTDKNENWLYYSRQFLFFNRTELVRMRLLTGDTCQLRLVGGAIC